MSAGRLVAQGTLDELRRGNVRIEVRTPDVSAAIGVLASLGLVVASDDSEVAADRAMLVSAALPEGRPPETITAALVAAGVRVRGVAVVGDTLESRFVALTGEGFDVAG
jgi:ABC-2 type transport system ATP-binding protein